MTIPLVEDQMRRRHQIKHRSDDAMIEPWRWQLAVFREALVVLRPQAMHDERIGARTAHLPLGPCRARPPLRRTMVTMTATARKSRTALVYLAADPGQSPFEE